MLIISVVGGLSSGKTTVAKMFAAKLNCGTIEIGDLVRKITGSSDRAVLQAELNKHTKEPNWFYDELVKEINKEVDSKFKVAIVSGIREPILLCQMMDEHEVISVTIEANDFIRYKRLIQRDGFTNLQDFRVANEKDIGLGLDITMSMSHYSIDTTQSLDALERRVEQILLSCGQIPVYYKND